MLDHATDMLAAYLLSARPLPEGNSEKYAANAKHIARQALEIMACQMIATAEVHQRDPDMAELFFQFGAMMLGVEMLKLFAEWDQSGLPQADGACGDALAKAAMIIGDRITRMAMLD